MASPTVTIFSASSSGISRSNSSSNAITSSTVSRESAPRSSMNLAFGLTSSSSTPSCSQMISFTRSSTGLAMTTSSRRNELRNRMCPPKPAGHLFAYLHVQAAVDVDHLARDIGRPVTGEEAHHLRHLAPRTYALERHLGHQRLAGRRRDVRRHVGLDQPGRHRVDQD